MYHKNIVLNVLFIVEVFENKYYYYYCIYVSLQVLAVCIYLKRPEFRVGLTLPMTVRVKAVGMKGLSVAIYNAINMVI